MWWPNHWHWLKGLTARRCCCIQRGFVDKTRLEWSNFHFYDTANHGGQLISRSGRGSLLGWNRAPVFFTAWWLWQSVPLFFTSLMTQANTGRGFGLFTQLVGWSVCLNSGQTGSQRTDQPRVAAVLYQLWDVGVGEKKMFCGGMRWLRLNRGTIPSTSHGNIRRKR